MATALFKLGLRIIAFPHFSSAFCSLLDSAFWLSSVALHFIHDLETLETFLPLSKTLITHSHPNPFTDA